MIWCRREEKLVAKGRFPPLPQKGTPFAATSRPCRETDEQLKLKAERKQMIANLRRLRVSAGRASRFGVGKLEQGDLTHLVG